MVPGDGERARSILAVTGRLARCSTIRLMGLCFHQTDKDTNHSTAATKNSRPCWTGGLSQSCCESLRRFLFAVHALWNWWCFLKLLVFCLVACVVLGCSVMSSLCHFNLQTIYILALYSIFISPCLTPHSNWRPDKVLMWRISETYINILVQDSFCLYKTAAHLLWL